MQLKKLFLAVLLLPSIAAGAQNINVRAAYNIGGTMPIPLPSSIRGVNKFQPTASFSVGGDYEQKFGERWGVMGGVRVEHKGMDVNAKVKLYQLTMERGGEILSGMFTGNVGTKMSMWMVTIPIQATFQPSPKVRLKLGPALSYSFQRSFTGTASEGYLRKGDPTGPKILIGDTDAGSFDFSNDLRPLQVCVLLGADWYILKHLGISAEVSYGLMNTFKADFTTIEQKMSPVYGSIGLCYQL